MLSVLESAVSNDRRSHRCLFMVEMSALDHR